MAFAAQLEGFLKQCETLAACEFANGNDNDLGAVLNRYLLAVEAAADTEMLTSILLLDGKSLRHGAAPRLPAEYCSAVDGIEIGPKAGSCGTAAHVGHAIYVTDIATDPLWADWRDLALEHGLRACWSTPILDDTQTVIATFAIYHLTPRAPTSEEVRAIDTITEHVARAIAWSRATEAASAEEIKADAPSAPSLRLVGGADVDLPSAQELKGSFDVLVDAIDVELAKLVTLDPYSLYIRPLQRAKAAAEKGKALAQRHLPRD
jgi:GAF domain-containing protein